MMLNKYIFIYCKVKIFTFDFTGYAESPLKSEDNKFENLEITDSLLKITLDTFNGAVSTADGKETDLIGYSPNAAYRLCVPFEAFIDFCRDQFQIQIWDLSNIKIEQKGESSIDEWLKQ